MTMRQVHALMKQIGRADLVEFYSNVLSYATAQGTSQNLPSLENFLAVTSGETPKEQIVFDEKTDKVLEERALARLEEMKAKAAGAPNGR